MADKSDNTDKNEAVSADDKMTVTCLGVSVPCDEREQSSECPSLFILAEEIANIQQYVCDKDVEISTLSEFKIKQMDGLFKPNTHYWFAIRYNEDSPEIRYIAPYADDVVAFFQNHYYIDQIGHSSVLPLDEFVASYNSDNPGEFVHYAGTFTTDENGKITYWSNDSGPFDPSEDYAAPVAEALGINDAIFIARVQDDMDQTIYYRQYKDYTGAYHANNEPIKLIEEGEEQTIFYPHNYHKWYKYHGHEKHTITHHTHHNHHSLAFLQSPLFWGGILIAVVCGIIGFIVSVFVSKQKKPEKDMVLKQDGI